MGSTRDTRSPQPKRRKIAAIPPPIRPRLDREHAKRLYERGLTMVAIARRTGFAEKTVQQALREDGVKPRLPVTRTGKWASLIYRRWKGIRGKCRNRNDVSFHNYGGKGLRVCAEWESFPAFREWALSSGFRPGLDLALIRRDRDFSPRNCRWQARSASLGQRKGERTPRIRAFGETKTLSEWVADRRCVVPHGRLRRRLQDGFEPEAAMTIPADERRRALRSRKRSRPLLGRKRYLDVESTIDWKKAEREWRAHPMGVATFARRLGTSSHLVLKHLGHAGVPERKRPVPVREEEHLRLVWHRLLRKDGDPSDRLYRYVGGKGIHLCAAWKRFEPFLEWAASSGYRPGLWLARIDRRRGYSPANCAWMAPDEAGRRPKYDVKLHTPRWPVEIFGEVKSPSAWARDRRCQVSQSTLLRRLRGGWDAKSALTTPPEHAGPPAWKELRAFGVRKTLVEWVKDRRCRVTLLCLRLRLMRGVPGEVALSAPAYQIEVGPKGRPRPRSRG